MEDREDRMKIRKEMKDAKKERRGKRGKIGEKMANSDIKVEKTVKIKERRKGRKRMDDRSRTVT